MLELPDLIAFTRVVELETLTSAARSLGLPTSTVSRRLARLERTLGVQLLRRSPQAVVPTEQGALFYRHCKRGLGVLQDGERALREHLRHPRGVVRIALSHTHDRAALAPLLAEYLELYPDVRLAGVVADDPVALLRQGFEVAIMPDAQLPADSALQSHALGQITQSLYAAPAYAERMGLPQGRVDLTRFDLLALDAGPRPAQPRALWRLHRGAEEISVEFRPRLAANDLLLLLESARAGTGIAMLPDYLVRGDAAQGRLQPVMPEWQGRTTDLSAVLPGREGIAPHVARLVALLVEHLRPAASGPHA